MNFTKDTNFPYSSRLICYFKVYPNGEVIEIKHNKEEIEKACLEETKNKCEIYAVWPGNYTSSLYKISDVNLLLDAYGIKREYSHTHSIRWNFSSFDDGKSLYAYIDIIFLCGCEISFDNIKRIGIELKNLLGWDIATSTGIGQHVNKEKTVYSIKVRRNSIKSNEFRDYNLV